MKKLGIIATAFAAAALAGTVGMGIAKADAYSFADLTVDNVASGGFSTPGTFTLTGVGVFTDATSSTVFDDPFTFTGTQGPDAGSIFGFTDSFALTNVSLTVGGQTVVPTTTGTELSTPLLQSNFYFGGQPADTVSVDFGGPVTDYAGTFTGSVAPEATSLVGLGAMLLAGGAVFFAKRRNAFNAS